MITSTPVYDAKCMASNSCINANSASICSTNDDVCITMDDVWPPSMPIPMSPAGPCRPSSTEPYTVCFKFGDISVCNGCRNKFSESDNLVIQHKEFRNFISPHNRSTIFKVWEHLLPFTKEMH